MLMCGHFIPRAVAPNEQGPPLGLTPYLFFLSRGPGEPLLSPTVRWRLICADFRF